MRGILIAATVDPKYYEYAINCIESIKDHSDLHITLATHHEWTDSRCRADTIINPPRSKRAKIWALDKVRYDVCAYLDADTIVVDDRFQDVHDILENHDIALCRITKEAAAQTWIDIARTRELTDHCGFMVYDVKSTRKFMNAWWKNWLEQREGVFEKKFPKIHPGMRQWDQFAFMRTRDQMPEIKVKYVGKEWNYVYLFDNMEEFNNLDPIVYHGVVT